MNTPQDRIREAKLRRMKTTHARNQREIERRAEPLAFDDVAAVTVGAVVVTAAVMAVERLSI